MPAAEVLVEFDVVHANHFASMNVDDLLVEQIAGEEKQAFRAVGNAVMVLLLGAPVLAAMARFRSRFSLVVEPADPTTAAPPSQPGRSR